MSAQTPGELELTVAFSQHLGGRSSAAGLTVQFHYNQEPGTHFKTEVPPAYRNWILKGIKDGMAKCFPEFPLSGSIWITAIHDDEINSSQMAFYRASRLAISQALGLNEMTHENGISPPD